jgi:hypothetical protein
LKKNTKNLLNWCFFIDFFFHYLIVFINDNFIK